MRRRELLLAALPLPALAAAATEGEAIHRIATSWRPGDESPHRVGVIELDWSAGHMRIEAETEVPERAHGLLALPEGGFVAVANKPGRWLMRFDARGEPAATLRLEPAARRTLNGHVEIDADARLLYSTETDAGTGRGWITVRELRTLEAVAEFETGGIDPHHLLRDTTGHLLVANGGIVRDAMARKIDAAPMDPSLVRIDPASGRIEGQWRLDDRQLSLRHMAWSAADRAQLGIGLQAEHAEAGRRRDAPTLAVWNGQDLSIATRDASAGGYAGDIAAGPGGGFVISAQKSRRCLWWHEAAPARLQKIAELTEACALVSWDDGRGVLIGAGRGIARWHGRLAPHMLAWPLALAPDNHAVMLRAG
jgi:hypothetical protein